ncbi:MAG: peptide chain release factor N(5)-glutamine methyltransferase [Myxococcaceae bacterium]
MTDTWTVRRVLGWTAQHFERKNIDSPRLTAEVLLAHTLATSRVRLYTDLDRPLDSGELSRYRGFVERRTSGEPTQYLTGQREFYGRPFQVDARVLIPRPETELLVETVLQRLPSTPLTVADVCTGSGCIGVTLAAEREAWRVHATDLSKDACLVAEANAKALGVTPRFDVSCGDLLGPLPGDVLLDAVVSNPPYVASAEIDALSKEVRQEPRAALDGGVTGVILIERLAREASRRLKPGGLLALEIGEHQGAAVANLLTQAGFADIAIEKDLAKLDRFAFGVATADAASANAVLERPHGRD